MAALALMTIACSNDNELKPQQPTKTDGIPFIATISGNSSAVTRALSEANNGNIVATWTVDEQVALIYNVGERKCNTTATVIEVDSEGTATITATLEDGTADGTEVTIIYPASAVDPDTYDVKSDLLENQDGTLEYISKYLDLHIGTGHLSIDDVATLQESVKLDGKLAIFNLTLDKLTKTANDNDSYFKRLVVSFDDENGEYQVAGSVNIPQNTNQFCVAIRPGTILPDFPMLWFEATTTKDKNYINHGKSNKVHIVENKYYHTTVSLATVGDFILPSGKFVAKGNTQGKAVIAHVGKVDNYFDRFLAIARTDISGRFYNMSAAQGAVNDYADANSFEFLPVTTTSTDGFYDKVVSNQNTASNTRSSELGVQRGWRLPTVTDWRYIFQNLCNGLSATSPVGIKDGAYGDGDDYRNAINEACNVEDDLEEDKYWTSSQYGNDNNAWGYIFDEWSKFESGAYLARAVFAY